MKYLGKARWHERRITRERARKLPNHKRIRESQEALRDWAAWQVSGPISMGILWRPKRDGGPYRLLLETA